MTRCSRFLELESQPKFSLYSIQSYHFVLAGTYIPVSRSFLDAENTSLLQYTFYQEYTSIYSLWTITVQIRIKIAQLGMICPELWALVHLLAVLLHKFRSFNCGYH